MKAKKSDKSKKPDETEAKCRELLEDLQRVQAEFENFKKRMERDKEQFVEFANSELIKEFLPVLDSVQAALKAVEGDAKGTQGIELIKKQLMQVLEKHGLQEIECRKGELFDAQKHQCLAQGSEKELKDGSVLEELQKGYLLKGRVLRPSMAKLNKLGE